MIYVSSQHPLKWKWIAIELPRPQASQLPLPFFISFRLRSLSWDLASAVGLAHSSLGEALLSEVGKAPEAILRKWLPSLPVSNGMRNKFGISLHPWSPSNRASSHIYVHLFCSQHCSMPLTGTAVKLTITGQDTDEATGAPGSKMWGVTPSASTLEILMGSFECVGPGQWCFCRVPQMILRQTSSLLYLIGEGFGLLCF